MTATRRLPPARTDAYAWQQHAACRGADSAMFFPPAFEQGAALRRREDQAKRICTTCRVQTACRQHALTVGEPYGVWGGLTPAERAALDTGIPDSGH